MAPKGTLNEMAVLKGMHHPHIVQLREVLDDQKEPNIYLVMQYLPGKNLKEVVYQASKVYDLDKIRVWTR